MGPPVTTISQNNTILPSANLDTVDLVVIVIYFAMILAVGLWVSFYSGDVQISYDASRGGGGCSNRQSAWPNRHISFIVADLHYL